MATSPAKYSPPRPSLFRLTFALYCGMALVLVGVTSTINGLINISSYMMAKEAFATSPAQESSSSSNSKLREAQRGLQASAVKNSTSLLHSSSDDGSASARYNLSTTTKPIAPFSNTSSSSPAGSSVLRARKQAKVNVTFSATSPYAYSFVIGGLDETKPSYKGFIYNILVSVNVLRKLGSQADFVCFLQLSPNSTRDTLPEEDVTHLQAQGIKVVEIMKPRRTSFSDLMLEKFRSLQLTQYKRVIYLDSDVMPLANLDYLFIMSDPDNNAMPTLLKPSIIWASRGAPCNGGFFMLHPYEGAWDEILGIVERQREEGRKLPYPHFDFRRGFGHDFKKHGDEWQSIKSNGTSWRFHGGFTDQGLWLYYAKYVVQEVSIIIGRRVQNWRAGSVDENSLPVLESQRWEIFRNFTNDPLAWQEHCDKNAWTWTCYPPTRDMAHFMGKTKPWQVGGLKKRLFQMNDTEGTRAPHRLWFRELEEVNGKLDLGLDIPNWDTVHMPMMKKSPLGYLPKYTHNMHRIFDNSTLKSSSTS